MGREVGGVDWPTGKSCPFSRRWWGDCEHPHYSKIRVLFDRGYFSGSGGMMPLITSSVPGKFVGMHLSGGVPHP